MHAALLVIDVQESFRHRPYFEPARAGAYLQQQNALIGHCQSRGIPIVRILHTDGPEEASNPFSLRSGHVRPLEGLADFAEAARFVKRRHSALVGTGLDVWLTERGIGRLIVSGIRTEQCCETTTRHASDLGWSVDYLLDATLTFDMQTPDGRPLSASDLAERTAAALHQRFAHVSDVATWCQTPLTERSSYL
ncbi:isochorismatase family protein [Curvibacter sp. CHRR-16]|uniref:cysteine hydrolase family protein n=1 Tax=Curvibacter sp. CHRR-16 TaxID=2835872 RepID=UPI001BDA5AAF|nr:isochorismatase family protein [Curvibacter sp. CHRR-16]MBT0569166.1 isochorismatase family protein [Curvibacter sp. CHRR-16]